MQVLVELTLLQPQGIRYASDKDTKIPYYYESLISAENLYLFWHSPLSVQLYLLSVQQQSGNILEIVDVDVDVQYSLAYLSSRDLHTMKSR